MATITIHRRTGFFGTFVGAKVFLDEQEIGLVSNNEEASFEVTPGDHELYVKMGGGYRNEPLGFRLGEGESRRFELETSPLARAYTPVMIVFVLSILSRFIFPEGLGQPVLQLVVSVAALVFFIVVFAQRGRFFTLREV